MRHILAALLILAPALARAEVPRVVADIAPVHSLAQMVMGDLGEVALLLPASTDPHGFQMRPSQARALSRADLVVWTGAALTPWLPDALAATGREARALELLATGPLPLLVEGSMGTLTLAEPEGPIDRDGGAAEHDGHHAQNDHGDAAHDDHAGEGHAHDHGPTDPHAWLDPLNAAHFVAEIAGALAELDPDNAETYRANAAAAADRLRLLADDVALRMAPHRRATLIPYHDAYRYFLIRFDLPVAGALASVEGVSPGAGRVSEIRALLRDRGPRACVFAEPGANRKLLATILPDGRDAPELDPLGHGLAPGPDLYVTLIENIARAIETCSEGA